MTYPLFSTAFVAYSVWKILPSGENVVADKSYYQSQDSSFQQQDAVVLTPVPIALIAHNTVTHLQETQSTVTNANACDV